MLAIHDQFTRQMRSRLKITGMGLGLVRLLQDARRFGEARTALSSLENGFLDVARGIGQAKAETLQSEPLDRRLKKFLVPGSDCEKLTQPVSSTRQCLRSKVLGSPE